MVTILVQTAGVIWFAANLNARVSKLEDETPTVDQLNDRTLRLEILWPNVDRRLDMMDTKLDRLLSRPPPQ